MRNVLIDFKDRFKRPHSLGWFNVIRFRRIDKLYYTYVLDGSITRKTDLVYSNVKILISTKIDGTIQYRYNGKIISQFEAMLII